MTDNLTEDQEQKHLFQLADVTVDTLGLVGKGAIGLNWFLTKSEDGESVEENEIIEDQPSNILEKLGLNRLLQLAKRGEEAEAVDQAIEKILSGGARRGVEALLDSYGADLPSEVTDMLQGLLEDQEALDDNEMEAGAHKRKDKKVKKDHDEVNIMADNTQKPQTVTTPVSEAQPSGQPDIAAELQKRDEQLEALMARLEKAENSYEAMTAEVEKARSETAEVEKAYQNEKAARERMIYIEKAEAFAALPVESEQLGEFLHWLAKEDQAANVEKAEDAEDRSNRFGFVADLLKAINEQVIQSGFFNEKGSAKIPKTGTLIEKAQAAVDAGTYETLREALMHVNAEQAETYLSQFDQ